MTASPERRLFITTPCPERRDLGVTDYRTAGNAKLTKYFNPVAVGVGAAVSSERDYLSRALSLDVGVSSDDRNRTLAFRHRRRERPYQQHQRCRRRQGKAYAGSPGRHHAGAVTGGDRAVDAHLFARAWLLLGPVQSDRRTPRSPSDFCVAHSLQSTSAVARCDRQPFLSLPA